MLSKQRKQKLESNIRKFYLYRILCGFVFISPIFVLFLQDNGLSMTQVMILQSIYTALIMLFVVPFGILADYIGKKKVLIANEFFYAAGWIAYALGTNFLHFVIAEIMIAISTAMWTSTGTAFFYDNLKELRQEAIFKKSYGKIVGINSMMWGIAGLIGAYIATFSLRLPFWISAIPASIALFVTLTFTEPKVFRHADKKYLTHLKDAVGFAAKHPKVRLFIIYTAIVNTVIFSAFMMYQPYLKSIGLNFAYFGVVYLFLSLAFYLGSRYAHIIERKLGEKRILFLMLILFALIYFGMANISLIYGLLLPICISFVCGVFEPVITDYLHKHVESHHRATVSSLSILVTEGFSAVIAPFFGYVFDVYSLQSAFILAGAIIFGNFIILLLVYQKFSCKK